MTLYETISKGLFLFEFITVWAGCLIGYFFYGIGGIGFLTLVLPLSLILLPFGNSAGDFLRGIMRLYLAFLTRSFLPALQIYSIKEIHGFGAIPKNRGVIIVSNHRGKLDGPFLLGLLANTVAIMKLKYASLPVYAALVKKLDFVSLDPHSIGALEQTLARAKTILASGKNILIFPEGTRTTSRRLLPFKELAFKLAQEQQTAIVPVIVYSKYPFMAKNFSSFFPLHKNSFTIRCLEPVFSLAGEHPSDMAARVRERMSKELAFLEKTDHATLKDRTYA